MRAKYKLAKLLSVLQLEGRYQKSAMVLTAVLVAFIRDKVVYA